MKKLIVILFVMAFSLAGQGLFVGEGTYGVGGSLSLASGTNTFGALGGLVLNDSVDIGAFAIFESGSTPIGVNGSYYFKKPTKSDPLTIIANGSFSIFSVAGISGSSLSVGGRVGYQMPMGDFIAIPYGQLTISNSSFAGIGSSSNYFSFGSIFDFTPKQKKNKFIADISISLLSGSNTIALSGIYTL